MRGTAFLHVHLTPARSYDLSVPGAPTPVYAGPDRVGLDGHTVTEVVRTGDFEANLQWVIGLRQDAGHAVTFLEQPMRLVIDLVPAPG